MHSYSRETVSKFTWSKIEPRLEHKAAVNLAGLKNRHSRGILSNQMPIRNNHNQKSELSQSQSKELIPVQTFKDKLMHIPNRNEHQTIQACQLKALISERIKLANFKRKNNLEKGSRNLKVSSKENFDLANTQTQKSSIISTMELRELALKEQKMHPLSFLGSTARTFVERARSKVDEGRDRSIPRKDNSSNFTQDTFKTSLIR